MSEPTEPAKLDMEKVADIFEGYREDLAPGMARQDGRGGRAHGGGR